MKSRGDKLQEEYGESEASSMRRGILGDVL
jgi:hypothetical protein